MEETTTTDGQLSSDKNPSEPLGVTHDRGPQPVPSASEEPDRLVLQLAESLREVQFERSLWKATVESMLDPVTVSDAVGRAIYMNSAYSRLVGYQIGQDVPLEQHAAHYQIYHEDGTLYESTELPLQRAALLGEDVKGAELIHVTASGRRIYTVWNASPIRSTEGTIVGAVAVGKDVTEQRRADATRARLAAIVESSDDAIIGKSLDGTVTDWNRGASKLYGYAPEEMIGKSISTIVAPEAMTEFEEIMARLRRAEPTQDMETVRLRKDGSRVYVSLVVSPILDGNGKIIGASTVARDVTAQRRARDAERFLGEVSAALSGSLDYEGTLDSVARLAVPTLADLCIVDIIEDHRVRQQVYAQDGKSFVKCLSALQLQYSPEQEGAHPVWEVMRTGTPLLLTQQFPPQAQTAISEMGRMPEALVNAGAHSCLMLPLIIRGRPEGAISLVLMNQEREYAAEDLQLTEQFASRAAVAVDNARLYREARNAVRARDEFLSVAAHELKTPMTSLRGFVQLAMRQIDRGADPDPSMVRQALRVIDQQSRRLAALVSQLLDVTRLEAGRLSLQRMVVDVSSMVEAAVATAALSNTEHTFSADIQPSVLAVVDPIRIEQVVTALIENATKFSPLGTRVDLELSQPTKETVRLIVRDRGPGVPAEQRSQIFTRFYHGQPNEQAGGMGLGLYISREIVQLHGGTIAAEFPDDGGSRFVVTLPTNLADLA